MTMDNETFEKRFTAMEQKVDLMTEFINSLKASVEEDKKKPVQKSAFESIFDL